MVDNADAVAGVKGETAPRALRRNAETGQVDGAPSPEGASDEGGSEPKLKQKLRKLGVLAAQMAVIIAVYEAGCVIAGVLPIDLPGNIVGMGLLLALLATGVLKNKHVGTACDYLIDNMSIFFVPAGVGILGCFSMLEDSALKFAFVCVATTVIVFLATSWTVILVERMMEKRAQDPAANVAGEA